MTVGANAVAGEASGSCRVWIDGVPVTDGHATVSVFDHGFLFGDSVYEVLRGVETRLVRPREHLERLEHSAQRLRLALPLSRAELEREIEAALAAAGNGDSYVRLIVTRGEGLIEISPESCVRPRRILIVDRLRPFPERWHSEGLRMALVGVVRNLRQAVDPAVKSGNYLNSVLAIMEARERGADDGIMCNREGNLAEGTTANVFFVGTDGVLRTPGLSCGILSGVTRRTILQEHAPALGIEVKEGDYSVADLLQCREAFMSSSLKGVMGIGWIDGAPLPAPVPGEVTRALQASLEREIASLR